MHLIDINKTLYRKRLNIVIFISIFCLTVLSISFGAILIELFGYTLPDIDPTTGEKPSNFRFNFVGVILALLTCISILQQFKNHPYCFEIHYVMRLKQIHNIIYRRLNNIKKSTQAFESNEDINAFIVLNYYYTSLKQVYLLDNNTLTLSSLEKDMQALQQRMTALDIKVNTDQFERAMLIDYR